MPITIFFMALNVIALALWANGGNIIGVVCSTILLLAQIIIFCRQYVRYLESKQTQERRKARRYNFS